MINISELIEVTLRKPDDFLKIKETLTRIGIASKKIDERNGKRTLYQSCHILSKRGKYYILSFKELFLLDGKETNFSLEDRARRNTIANLLHDWELLDLVEEEKTREPEAPLKTIKVLTHKEKQDWNLVPKYTFNSIKKRENETSDIL